MATKTERNRQRFDLATDDIHAECDRLVALGAAIVQHHVDAVELADPDGNEFFLVDANGKRTHSKRTEGDSVCFDDHDVG